VHRHFATICSRIKWFSPKCSEKISVNQTVQNLYQLVKYFLINKRRHPACEHDTSDSWRSSVNKDFANWKGWIVKKWWL